MTAELFANTPSTTVTGGGTDAPASGTQETWTVASSAAFPAAVTDASQFHVGDPAASSEVIGVTNVSGDTWTVTRGAESTIPVVHASGFTVWQVASAGVLASFAQAGLGDLGGSGDAPQVTGTHLAEALPFVQGGTGQETQQLALNALAGGTTSGYYLRGDGSNVALSAILAADLPAATTSTQGALKAGASRPATLIVAASGSSAAWKAVADYVCTGTNDDVQINAALAALPSIGGTVLLSDGTFGISNPVIPTINASVLRGQGTNATVIQQRSGSGTNGYQYNQVSQNYNLIFCSIQSLTFLGNYNAGAGDTTGYGCYINYTYGGGGHYTFWDFYLRDVWFENWPQDGFYSTGGHGYVLDHCLAEYNGGNGINFAGGFTDTPPRILFGTIKINGGDGIICNADGGYVAGNEISNNTGDGLSLGGLTSVGVGNLVKLNNGTGIILVNSGARAIGNYVTNNKVYGIHATGGHEGCAAIGNTVAYSAQHGILSDNARTTIDGNYCLSSSYSGAGGTTNTADEINITTGTFNAIENSVFGNVINGASSSRYGINFATAASTQGAAVANQIQGAVTALVNTAAPDTQWLATPPYQSSTLPRTVTNNYTLVSTDNIVLLNAAAKTLTLPTAAGVTGKQYTGKLIASSTGTVATTSSQTIDGSTTYSLPAQYKYVTVVSDGANWQIVANN